MANYLHIIWDDDNTDHIAEHGLSPEDCEFVLDNPGSSGISKSSGRPCDYGYTSYGVFIIVIYEQVDEDTIYPVTAFPLDQ